MNTVEDATYRTRQKMKRIRSSHDFSLPASHNLAASLMDDLTPESALVLIKPFFPDEWSKTSVNDVVLKKIT